MRRPTPAPRRRKRLLRLLAVAVVASLAAVGWRASTRAEKNVMSLGGATVRTPAAVLSSTESRLRTLVARQHGAAAAATRCYFEVASRTGAHRYEISGRILCGPALFVDGDPAKAYVEYGAVAGPAVAGAVTLTSSVAPQDAADSGPPREVATTGLLLVRPDGRHPPSRGLRAAPVPPPAADDLLSTAATLGTAIRRAPADAVMTGRNAGVQLLQYGFTSRYGAGPDARSAGPGRRLLAFSLATLPGEYAAKNPNLALDVDGEVRGPLVITAGYIVTEVPVKAAVVDLVMTDGPDSQRLSLLNGAPAGQNPAVSSRLMRTDPLAVSKPVRVRVASGAKSGVVTGTVQFRAVWLSYWAADGSHAASPKDALLHVTATVRLAGDRQAYGAEAPLLTASIAGGPSTSARNAAQDPSKQVDDVIEVPADTTAGTLTYSGRVATTSGSITVVTPVRVAFTISN